MTLTHHASDTNMVQCELCIWDGHKLHSRDMSRDEARDPDYGRLLVELDEK